MLRTVAIKILCFLLVLAGLELLYSATLYPTDLEEKSKEILEIRNSQEKTDIYYFGESSNVTYHEEDSLKNSISELVNMFYPSLKITNINKYATHSGIYKHWVKEIDLNKKKPLAVIITLNLRSFNATWINSDLETQLQESLVFANPYPNLVNRFLLSLQAFDNKTPEQREKEMLNDWKTTPLRFPYDFKYKTVHEWDAAMANGSYLKPDGSWDTEKIILACHYIKGYAFNLHEQNVRIRDFDEIVDWCAKNDIKLYLNLLAENIQFADSLVGRDLVFLMKQNRDFLIKRYHRNHCKVVDNLEALPGEQFIDQTWTTEHYRYKGRMKIARTVADTIKEQLKTQYKEAY